MHDRQTGETTRVSIGADGIQANGDSFAPAISGDGRYVVFSSSASNLVPGDKNNANDIFVRDTTANPPPPPRCVVPKVIGLKLAAARKRIARARCAVGTVRRVHVRSARKVGRVIAQSPKAGTRRPAGTRVSLAVGRR